MLSHVYTSCLTSCLPCTTCFTGCLTRLPHKLPLSLPCALWHRSAQPKWVQLLLCRNFGSIALVSAVMFMTQNGARAVLLPLLAMQGFGLSAKLLGTSTSPQHQRLCSIMHLFFTYSSVHSFVLLPTHLFTHLFMHACTHLAIHASDCWFLFQATLCIPCIWYIQSCVDPCMRLQ